MHSSTDRHDFLPPGVTYSAEACTELGADQDELPKQFDPRDSLKIIGAWLASSIGASVALAVLWDEVVVFVRGVMA